MLNSLISPACGFATVVLRARSWTNAGMVLVLLALLLMPAQVRADWFTDLGGDWQKFTWSVETTNDTTGDTTGNDFFWTSDDPVLVNGMPQIEYRAEITKVEARVVLGGNNIWTDVTALFEDRDTGFITAPAVFPLDIVNENVDVPDVLQVTLYHGVVFDNDSNDHRLVSSLTGAVFGNFPDVGWPITGFRANAQTALHAVPEPGSLALLGSGGLIGLMFWRRRRK